MLSMNINTWMVMYGFQRYTIEHEAEDCLLVGFPSQKANPFREKSTCTLL